MLLKLLGEHEACATIPSLTQTKGSSKELPASSGQRQPLELCQTFN